MSDELLLIEIERLRQMLEIASVDISKFIGCKPSDYLHDLGTRDFFEEIKENDRKEGNRKMRTFDDLLEYELGKEIQLFNAPRQNPRNSFETGTKGKIIEFFENGLMIETEKGEQIRIYLPVVACKM